MDEVTLIGKLESLLRPIAAEEGLQLWDIQWTTELGRKILRVMVEKDDGTVSLGDCSRLSHAIEDIIEVKDLIPARYDLEVSSPGLNRPLRHQEHFEKVLGKIVTIRTKIPLEGRRNYKGRVLSTDSREVVVKVDQTEYRIPFSEISKANLEYFAKE